MSQFVSSPVWGAVITVMGAVMTGIVTLVVRILGKLSSIEDQVKAVAQDVAEIRSDSNIVRWSDVARTKIRRGRGGI